MTGAVIFLGIISVLLFGTALVTSILLYFSIKSSFVLQDQITEYEDFIVKISSILEEDVDFLRGSLARKLSMDIPEVQELNRGLSTLKDDITRVKASIEQIEKKKARG